MSDNEGATLLGLQRCLRMLAEEASSLNLTRTLEALQTALETCRSEAVGRPQFYSTALH